MFLQPPTSLDLQVGVIKTLAPRPFYRLFTSIKSLSKSFVNNNIATPSLTRRYYIPIILSFGANLSITVPQVDPGAGRFEIWVAYLICSR